MTLFHLVKLIHILGASVLFGAGAAIAYFMLMAWRSGDHKAFAMTADHVVKADFLFTASAVILQPLSGALLIHLTGRSFAEPWLAASYALYLFIGVCWLPVVWIQLRVRQLLMRSDGDSAQVERLMRIWFCLGWPAFIAVLAIFILMVVKPVIS